MEGRETIPAPVVVTNAVEVAPGAAVVASPVVPTVVVASVVASVVVVARVVVASSLQNWQVASATQLQRPQST